MASAKQSKKARALQWLRSRGARRVDEALAFEYSAAFPDISPHTLKEALFDSNLELAPLVEGVRQDTFFDLERTLLALENEYESGDATRRRQVRELVITARQHADWAARNPRVSAEKRAAKTEMLLWIRTWLENPPLFRQWAALRRRACHGRPDAV